TKVTLQNEPQGGPASPPDRPLLDLSDALIKKLIHAAQKRGYVTHNQIKSVLPSEEINSEQIKDVLTMFGEMGVSVVETEKASDDEEQREEVDEEAEPESSELVEVQRAAPAKSAAKEPTERTDDPVRMYLREMGSMKLLSREGEIAIAKRIEASREAMIAGLCESPLTFQAIIIWRDELNEGKVFLRDIIDLEATYTGPDAKPMPAPIIGPDGQTTRLQPIIGVPPLAELKPKVVETFDNVADAYKRLRRLQDQDIQNKLRNDSLSPAQERRYKKLKDDIISEAKSLRLNQARIDALVEQLYDINKR